MKRYLLKFTWNEIFIVTNLSPTRASTWEQPNRIYACAPDLLDSVSFNEHYGGTLCFVFLQHYCGTIQISDKSRIVL